MGTRGPKAQAALTVIGSSGVETHKRPPAPSELTDEQAHEWAQIVSRMPADWFSRETLPLLAQYCRHIVTARRVQQMISAIEKDEGDDFDFAGYDKALKMQARESSAICSLATKMRISQQSTYDRTKKKGPSGSRGKKPWDV